MLEVLPLRFFLRMRLPPLLEPPRMQSRPSFLHRPHGGEPPDASLPCHLVSLGVSKEVVSEQNSDSAIDVGNYSQIAL